MILSAGIKQHLGHQKIKEYKHKYIFDKMGCCCSTETESWSKPLLVIDEESEPYDGSDILVQAPGGSSDQGLHKERSETPYSTVDEYVI